MISEEEASNVLCNENKNDDLSIPMFIDVSKQDEPSNYSHERHNKQSHNNRNRISQKFRKISDDSNMSNNFKNFQGSHSLSVQNPNFTSHNLVVRRNHKLCSDMGNIPPSITRLNFMGRNKLLTTKQHKESPQLSISQKNVLPNITVKNENESDRSIKFDNFQSSFGPNLSLVQIPHGLYKACTCASILIVDDQIINRLILNEFGNQYHLKSDEAENGKIAYAMFVESLNKTCCDGYKIILMDLNMPVMDGIKSASKIISACKGKENRPKIIAITAFASDEEIKK